MMSSRLKNDKIPFLGELYLLILLVTLLAGNASLITLHANPQNSDLNASELSPF